jgi:methoxymalonate biosynthesis protein
VIKCVVWDIDHTLLDGVYLESGPRYPAADPAMTGVLADLADRGILQALASRNPPDAAEYVQMLTGHRFAAAECGWGTKSDAIRRIIAQLGLAADAVAFVDDDALERAEVSFALPELTVLAPRDMADAASWPQFSPPTVTDEARRRGELYLSRQRRQEEASAFGGSRDDFLRYCQTRVVIASASSADVPRLHELSVRTHQFNSAGSAVSEDRLSQLLRSPDYRLITVRLRDRFGDDGLVGSCVIAAGAARPSISWAVPLLMMSCRAMGRGVVDVLLTWLCRAARAASADQLTLPCVLNERNVPLRIALTGAGFRADATATGPADSGSGSGAGAGSGSARPPDRTATYTRALNGPLPDLPAWVADHTDDAGRGDCGGQP